MSNTDLPDGWKVAKLSDLGEVGRGRSRHRPRHAPHLYGGPYPFIQTGDVKASGGRITSFSQSYSEAGLDQSRLWPAGTMCITIAANIAETGILGFAACFPDSIVGFIPDEEKCDVYFIEYTFRHLKRLIQHRASGTVQDNINLGTLHRLTFPLPPLPEQHAIARILGALDDKIELNREMNRTLEATAQALFKSWFVDFDPVVAKADGRKPFGMSEETAALFPDQFVETELGPIPEGWTCGRLGDIAHQERRGVHPDDVSPETPYIGLEHMPQEQLTLDQWGQAKEVSSAKSRFFQGEILFGKLRPYFHKVGVALVDGICSTDILVLKPVDSNWFGFALGHLSSHALVAHADATSSGTRQPRTNWRSLRNYQVCLPSKGAAAAYSTLVAPCIRKLRHNTFEAQTLANLRDLLLPKLLSGEIRVGEAEEAVEAVGA